MKAFIDALFLAYRNFATFFIGVKDKATIDAYCCVYILFFEDNIPYKRRLSALLVLTPKGNAKASICRNELIQIPALSLFIKCRIFRNL